MKQTLPFQLGRCAGMSVIFISLLVFFFSLSFTQAQCPLVCNDIQASLDNSCEIEITWDMLLEGTIPTSCEDDLLVEIFDPSGAILSSSPIITGDYINETLTGRVTYVPTGSFCEGEILVEDKLAPELTCADTLISCFHETNPATTGFPIIDDNCYEDLTAVYTDVISTFNCWDSDTIQIIDRNWMVTDSSANSSTCLQKIYIRKPALNEIVFPANQDGVQSPVQYCTSANTSISNTGEPHFAGISVHELCGFLAEYEDVTSTICDGSYTIFREWEVYDGCAGATLIQEQIIHVMDTLAPSLECPEDLTVTTGNNNCTATVSLPQPLTSDSCSMDITVSLQGSFGVISGTTIPNLAQGVYGTTCIATDGCGNSSNCLFEITVKDEAPPVAVGVSSPLISLLPQEPTYLPASTFDGGSWDNCNDITLEVRRLDNPECPGDDSTPFDTLVAFYCCDAGYTVPVQLRVTDLAGNTSMVTSIAQIQDNLSPQMTCPDHLTIDCEDDYLDLGLTGEPAVVENCTGFTVEYSDSLNLSNCGDGTVLRTWTVEDIGGHADNCTQEITIENLSPFYVNAANSNDPDDDIEWPENYISNTCGDGLEPDELPAGFDYPELFTDSICQLVGLSYSDTYLSQPTNACIEILRTWTVIDWCQFNPTTFEGTWSYGQIIRIQNSDAPVILTDCEMMEICSYDPDCEEAEAVISIEVEDDCTAANLLEIEYEIDQFDDGTIDETGTGAEVSSIQPIGIHRIYFTVEDGCQNSTTCDFLFTIKDCKKPTPICESMIAEISDQLTPTVSIHATELNASSSDNCTSASDLNFSFSSDLADTFRTFDCSEMGNNLVELWVSDEEGNQDFCEVMVEIQANTGACTDDALISGALETADGDSVAMAMVMVNSPSHIDSVETGLDGIFEFPDLEVGGDYTITPSKDTNPLNGVSTFDILLISKHILGIQTFDSPYTIIAADANNSGSVTTADLLLLRKLILFIETEFPNSDSWRFVDKDYEFPEPLNPFFEQIPEVVNINDLMEDEAVNFIAIKVGDVNGSVNSEE